MDREYRRLDWLSGAQLVMMLRMSGLALLDIGSVSQRKALRGSACLSQRMLCWFKDLN